LAIRPEIFEALGDCRMTERDETRESAEPTPPRADEPQPPDAAPTAEAAPTDQVEAASELERLRADLEAAERRAEEHLRGWQRTQADFINFRRRQEQEQAERVKQASAAVMRDLLPVLDDLDRAFATVPPALQELTWVEGLFLIDRKLRALLERHGLKPIEAKGKPFDPYLHEAVLREEGPADEQPIVLEELQRGYLLHDRLLRPALVKVGPARKSAPAGAAES
jgi:molecular chaperone GrpE